MKRSVPVQIAGVRYSLRSDGDDDAVRRVAAFVDTRIKEIQRQTRTADTQSLVILAALQIAEQLFAERDVHAALRKKIRERSKALLQLIDKAVAV